MAYTRYKKFTSAREAIRACKEMRDGRLIKGIAILSLAVLSGLFVPQMVEFAAVILGKLVIFGVLMLGVAIGLGMLLSVLDISDEMKRLKNLKSGEVSL